MTVTQIIEESEKRRHKLEEKYDPISGRGSYIDRVKIDLEDGRPCFVPAEMTATPIVKWCLEEGKTVQQYFENEKIPWQRGHGVDKWIQGRCRFDYEYYCHIGVNIVTKEGLLETLTMNRPQRISLAERELMRIQGKPIRQLELKHRQYGSTTEKNAYVFWFQNMVRERWNGYVISLQADQARKIVARYKTIADHYPPTLGTVSMGPYAGAQNTKVIRERDCFLAIGTAKNPNAPSGDTVQMVLISEAGKMASNTVQSAEKLITNIMSMVPLKPDTAILVESTAEESGRWFKREVAKARNEESGFHFTFISWVVDENLVLPVDDKRQFVESWSEYERETLWPAGATLEQINWYREKAKGFPEPWMMRQENPTTPDEAFQSGEKRIFEQKHVIRLREACRAAVHTGELEADAIEGSESLKNIEFVSKDMGHLKIWRKPGDTYGGYFDDKMIYSNRYAIAADVGGRWEGSDGSDIAVLDRLPTLAQEPPEIVAEWYGRGDSDLFAWICCQVATYYNKGKLYIESNYFERNPTRQEYDSSEVLTVLDIVRDYYDNLYLRLAREEGDIREKTNFKVGFHTNKKTKPIIINKLKAAMRRDPAGYVERAYAAVDEMETYIVHPNGYWGAAEGKLDDRVITRSLLMFAHEEMGAVKAIDPRAKTKRKKGTYSAAQF